MASVSSVFPSRVFQPTVALFQPGTARPARLNPPPPLSLLPRLPGGSDEKKE